MADAHDAIIRRCEEPSEEYANDKVEYLCRAAVQRSPEQSLCRSLLQCLFHQWVSLIISGYKGRIAAQEFVEDIAYGIVYPSSHEHPADEACHEVSRSVSDYLHGH